MSRFECFALGDIADEVSMEDCHSIEPDLGLFVVADGIGGRAGGGEASRTAVASLVRRFGELDAAARLEPARLREIVSEVNRELLARAEADPALSGLGTTLAALVLDETRARIVHVGDSRIYLFREGKLRQLTRDHTVTAELVEMERLTPECARDHPLRGFLSRFLGSVANWEPDIGELTVGPGDWLVLFTDGITAVLSDDRIESFLAEELPRGAEAVCRRLLAEALTREPPDNVTAIAVALA